MFHIHKKVHDSLGAIYCIYCRKFFGWKEVNAKIIYHDGAEGVSAWGYILNGPEWLARKMQQIRAAGGYYM